MADSIVLENSINTEINPADFSSKQWFYVNDNNNGNYSGAIVFDTTALSNNQLYNNYSEGYILMPLVMSLNGTSAGKITTNAEADFFCGLKCGFYNLINSMMVEFNTKNVVQQTQFLNVFTHFKTMTSWSQDDLKNNGFSYHVYPDTADSWAFNSAVSVNGIGLSNNNNSPPAISDINKPGTNTYNEGLRKRQNWLVYDPANNANGQNSIISLSNSKALYKNCVDASVAGKRVYNIIAKIDLKMLSDFFDKLPLLKGSKMTITLNTNQVKCDFTIATDGKITINNNVVQGNTNPLQLASINAGGAALKDTSATASYSVSLSIQKNNFQVPSGLVAGGDVSDLTSCRLYIPGYKFNPIAEQQYLSLAPVKKIVYRDIFQYTSQEVSSQFSINVTNGISNLRSVLVCPYLSSTTNGGTEQLKSPFSSMDPVVPITNFNIQVAGINLFNNNEQYDFEQFSQELKQSNQLNGNLTTGLCSGLISEYDFTSGKRYYYGDCSRIEPSQDGVARAVQLIGKIEAASNNIKPQLLCFCEFERSITVDVRTGQLTE